MDSAAIVDSVVDDLKKQSLGGVESKRKLNLEELNWDNSFVRELPCDPRSDNIPREVCVLITQRFLYSRLNFYFVVCEGSFVYWVNYSSWG